MIFIDCRAILAANLAMYMKKTLQVLNCAAALLPVHFTLSFYVPHGNIFYSLIINNQKTPPMRKLLLFFAFLFVTVSSFAHVWEIRVNQAQDGTLTWYLQSYHSYTETACQTSYVQSGLTINGVNYPIQSIAPGSIVGLSSTVFASNTSCGTQRLTYGIIQTPFLGTTLSVAPYSTVACWSNCSINAQGNFTPPPPPVCTACPLTGWTNTLASTGNNNGTLCDLSDDKTTATIKVSHLACANITGDKQFSLVFDPGGANISYGPFNYASGVETNVTIVVPFGTTSSTPVKVIDADFPCEITHGLIIPGGRYTGEKETVPPVITNPGNATISSCETVIPNYTDNAVASDNCTAPANIIFTQSPAAGTAIAPGATTTLVLTAKDESGNISSVNFTVTRPDVTPVATNDNATVCSGSSVNINVLGNDSHPQGATLTVNDNTIPSVGTLVKNADNTFTYTAPAGYSGPVTFTYTIKANDGTQAFAGNGHFYQFVYAPGICWTAARDAAKQMTFNGLQGYLVTITSPDENAFMFNKVGTTAWIGGSDQDQEGVWKWMDGPEAGQQFSGQVKYDWCAAATPGQLAGSYHNWSGGEPNDCGGFGAGSHAEDYAHFLSNGQWNDLPNCAGVSGYAVEYGGMEGCLPVLTATATVTINVNATPGAAITSNSPTTFCDGESVILTSGTADLYSWSTGSTSQSITVSQSGTYTVAASNNNGCSSTASTNVLVNPLPLVNARQGVTICPSSSAQLNATGSENGGTNNTANTKLCLLDAQGGDCNFSGNLCNDGYDWAYNNSYSQTTTITNANNISYKLYYTPCTYSVYFTFRLNGQVLGSYYDNTYSCTCDPSYYGQYPKTFSFAAAQFQQFWNNNGSNTLTVDVNDQYGSGVAIAGITVELSAPVSSYSWSPATGLNNPNIANPVANPSSTTVYTVTYTSANGCTATDNVEIKVEDNAAPVANITELPIITAECAANVIAPTATDNCVGTVTAITTDATSFNTQGTFQINWTYNDGNGNTSSQTQTVIIKDLTAPSITSMPGSISLNTDAAKCGAIVSWNTPSAFDNCGAVNLSSNYAPGDFFPEGNTVVTYTATDANGLISSASFTVTVSDLEAPFISCGNTINVNNDEGACSATVELVAPQTSDNCGVSTVANDHPSATFPVGTTVVTWTVTDIHGNANTCTQSVVVTDNEAPAANCKAVTITLVNGSKTITAADVDNTSADNCGVASVTISKSAFNCNNIGENEVFMEMYPAAKQLLP
jgi:hypothetical protein